MEKPSRKPITDKCEAKSLEELQRALVRLLDDLTETFAWTTLVCDGLSGLMTEHTSDIELSNRAGIYILYWAAKPFEKSAICSGE